MKNFIIRTIFGALLLAVIVGAIYSSPVFVALLSLMITIGGMVEFYALSRKQGVEPLSVVGISAGVAVWAAVISLYALLEQLQIVWISEEMMTVILAVALLYLVCITPVAFVMALFMRTKQVVSSLGVTILGVLYVALPISLLLPVGRLAAGVGVGYNPSALLLFILLVFANDVFAYLVGMSAHALLKDKVHRMCEKISPKKSWEGFFGGIAGAVAIGAIAAQLLDASTAKWIGLAVVTALASVIGDLIESAIKRSSDVKDSGTLIPGHGGILDRFDAMLFALPVAMIYLLVVELVLY